MSGAKPASIHPPDPTPQPPTPWVRQLDRSPAMIKGFFFIKPVPVSLLTLLPGLTFLHYSITEQCCGSGNVCLGSRIANPIFSIPDPGLTRSRIRIRIEEFKYSQLKTEIKSWLWIFFHSRSRIRILDPGSNKAPNPGSGSTTLLL